MSSGHVAYESQQAAAARNQVGPVGLRVEGVLGPQGSRAAFGASPLQSGGTGFAWRFKLSTQMEGHHSELD